MKILIKSDPTAPESCKRFFVTANKKIVKAHLTIEEAEKLQKQLKNKGEK